MGQKKGRGGVNKGAGLCIGPAPFRLGHAHKTSPTTPPHKPPIEPHRDPRDPQTPWRTYGEANGGVANKGAGLRLGHAPFS